MRVRDFQQILGKFTNDMKGTIISDCPIYIETMDGRLEEIVNRTRFAGGEIVKLFGNGSAFYAPAQSAIEMAESYLRDKKRIIPCASLCEGEFGINGYFIGVPSMIGKNGVEKILEFELRDNEKSALDNTLKAVKKTVLETKL